jgi:hypothetical protein
MTAARTQVGALLAPALALAAVAAVLVMLNTEFRAPPRFDGAGYAVLGEALAQGRGYREIDKPDVPPHAHFPPGYPAVLALLWSSVGRSVAAAHAVSLICTVAAVVVAWRWFRTMYPPRAAFLLGLALAVNWTWGRSGGSIQSEPLYALAELLAVFVVIKAGARNRFDSGILVGIALAACVLVRHVGLGLAAAVFLELGLRRHWRTLGAAVLVSCVLVLPWVLWLAAVGRDTQLGLLAQQGAAGGIPGRAVFYIQRLADQLTGPLVEVGTVFRQSKAIAVLSDLWAVAATAIIVWGWIGTLRTAGRRLVGLTSLVTLALLVLWPFTEAGRFLYPIVPFLLVGATEGLVRTIAMAVPGRREDWACGIVLAVSIPYAAYAIATSRAGAQRRTHADFDAACEWIKGNATRPGPILTRHPGEVFWQTGRQAVAPDSPDLEAISRLVHRLGVAYLLVDENRYANETASPLTRYVEQYPDDAVMLWSRSQASASIRIIEVSKRGSGSPRPRQ